MKTLTLKLPEVLETKLNIFAQQRGQSKSEVVREALAQYISRDTKSESTSFLDLAKDLSGTIEGPSDLSTNKEYLKNYGK